MTAPNASLSPKNQELSLLSANIARARSGLVQELVEVFNAVEVGGRPPVGGKAGTKGEWTIIRSWGHTKSIFPVTFYLSIKLPFEIKWSGDKLGVGVPSYICAGPGGEMGEMERKTVSPSLCEPQTSPFTSSTPSSANTQLFIAFTMLLSNVYYLN